jgi:threonine dehydrogenase-like Zn-dependent dehydrogenase
LHTRRLRALFDAPESMCIEVPDAMPTPRAVLAATMETALNIAWEAAPLAGERILVAGAGVNGLLTGWLLARIPASTVTLVETNPARAPLAVRLGCRFAARGDGPAEQDLVAHASASEAGLRLALDRAGFEARILEASWSGDRAPVVPLGEAFHARRLRLLSSQVGSVAAAMRARRSRVQRLALALELLADPVLDSLLEPPTPFAHMPAAMPLLLAQGLCHVTSYGTPPCSA